MTIYEVLKKEHVTVKGLLDELIALNDDSDDRRMKLIQKIRDELIPHSRAEEAVFYNSIRVASPKTKEVMHGFKEHMEAEMLLRTLQVKDKVSLDWRATAKKLRDALEHHIQEEESELFALGKKCLTEEEAVEIAKAFKKLKPEIKEEGMMANTLEIVKNLMPPRFTKTFVESSKRVQ